MKPVKRFMRLKWGKWMLGFILGWEILQAAIAQPPARSGSELQASTVLRDPDRVSQATISFHIGIASEGSGVVVGSRNGKILALSANHLFPDKTKEVQVSFFPTGTKPTTDKKNTTENKLKDAEVLESWPDIDLAIVAVDSPVTAPLPLQLAPARSRPEKIRGTTYTSGCDKGYPTIRPELLNGKVLTIKNSGQTEAFYWEMQDASIPGRSGGPLVDVDGKILGICSGTDKKGKGMYVHIDEIRAALNGRVKGKEKFPELLGRP